MRHDYNCFGITDLDIFNAYSDTVMSDFTWVTLIGEFFLSLPLQKVSIYPGKLLKPEKKKRILRRLVNFPSRRKANYPELTKYVPVLVR